jgi:predicted NBD/HSP70 family sugar kinase
LIFRHSDTFVVTQSKKTKHGQLTSINAKVARNINRAIILNLIRERQPISRSAISKVTGLNKSTVSNIVAGLITEDLVTEQLSRNQEIGRNPFDLRVRTGSHFVGAVYIESSKTQLAIVDIDGLIKGMTEIKTDEQHPAEFVAHCIEELDKLRTEFRVHNFRGIGVTVAGIVDSAQSKVVYAPNLGWENLDLGQIIRKLVPKIESITVENDAKASALAELLLGKHGVTSSNLVFLSVGYGIGAGIVLDNHILGGNAHAAGEFGHMTIVEGGDPCSCGNSGCWEVYASDRATVNRYAQVKQMSPDQASKVLIQQVVSASIDGDSFARKEITKTGQYLGRGIANIIRSFDPELIIVGGAITQAWNLVYPEIMETVNKRGFFGKQRNTTILPTSLSGNPPLLGAAALSIRKIFADRRIAL